MPKSVTSMPCPVEGCNGITVVKASSLSKDKLDALDRTAEELATAAQLIVDRREWAAQLPRDAELLAEHNRLAAEQEAASIELAEAIRLLKAKHAQQVGAIQQRLATIAIERDKAQTARNKLLQTSPERQRLAKLQDEHAAAVIALQGPLQVALRQAKPIDVGRAKGDIMETEARRGGTSCLVAMPTRTQHRPNARLRRRLPQSRLR